MPAPSVENITTALRTCPSLKVSSLFQPAFQEPAGGLLEDVVSFPTCFKVTETRDPLL